MLISYKSIKDIEILSSYECGFDPMVITRFFFSYRFYLISILFIVFDVEISLILPVPFLVSIDISFFIFFFFIFVLLVGLVYEYYCGSLD